MHWFLLALLSALSLAASDALTKRFLSDWHWRDILLVRFSVAALMLLPMLVIYPLHGLSTQQWLWLALAVPLELLAMRLYVTAISRAPLSQTLPYLAFTPVFTAVLGLLVLDETISVHGLVGILLVVLGAYLLNLKHAFGGQGLALWAPLQAIAREPAARMMLLVAAIYGVTSVSSKAAMRDTPPQAFGALYFVLVGGASLLTFGGLAPSRLRHLLSRPWAVLAISATMALMVVTHFLAIAGTEAAYMITVKRTSLLFGMLFGALWFGENDLLKNLGAGAMMVAGVGLVLL